jgi:hypothetical protein
MKSFIVILCLFFLAALPAFCADFYVSTAGSDSNPGTQAQPFATIQHGIDACPYTGGSSTVHLDGSTWFENPELEATNLFYPPDPPPDRPNMTVIGDYNGPNGMGGQDKSIINGCFTMIAYFEGTTTSSASLEDVTVSQILARTDTIGMSAGSGNLTLQNCTVRTSTSDGITCTTGSGADLLNVSSCIIYDCAGNGVTIQNLLPTTMNFHSCTIYNNQQSGVYLFSAEPVILNIYDNNIHANGSFGIIFEDISAAKVYNNILVNNLNYGVDIISNSNPDLGGGASSSPGDNTISGNGTYEVYNDSPNNIYAKNNHWDDQSEGEMAGGYYNTVDVTRIWDKWEDSSKGYIMWSDPAPTRTAAPSLGIIKATFYPSSNTINHVKAR